MNTQTPRIHPRPDYVPEELCWHHNLDDYPEQFDDPYKACAAVHQGPDIIWATGGAYRGKPGWVLTRYAHLQEAHADNTKFTTSRNRDLADLVGFELIMRPFESDPPEHSHYRQFLQPWFTPAAVKTRDAAIAETCATLIDRFQSERGCEFVGEFASLLPSHIFLSVMGLPLDMIPQFLKWEDGFMRGHSLDEMKAATRAIYDYFKDYLGYARKNPKDDLVTAIANAQVNGRRLEDIEAIGTCMLLYVAGLDSVKNSLGWQIRHLALDQTLQAHLRANPELIPAATNELLRYYGVTCNGRTVVQDTEFHGVKMKAGDTVAMPSFFASRDPREYTNPHIVDIDRNARHMTFGVGIHNCLGTHLAKQEVRIVLEQFLKRFQNIRIPEGAQTPWTSRGVWGFKALPLIWD
jgi:cytochrome P450